MLTCEYVSQYLTTANVGIGHLWATVPLSHLFINRLLFHVQTILGDSTHEPRARVLRRQEDLLE